MGAGVFHYIFLEIDTAQCYVHTVFRSRVSTVLAKGLCNTFIQQIEDLTGVGNTAALNDIIQQEVTNKRQQRTRYSVTCTVNRGDINALARLYEPGEVTTHHIAGLVEHERIREV